MNDDFKREYSSLKKERIEIIKSDPGDWPKDKIVYSYHESKTKDPELHAWYIKKSKINHKLWNLDNKVIDLEERVIESMESDICKDGNILVPRKPVTDYQKNLSYIILGKHSRDKYELYNNATQGFAWVHWKKIIKNYKLSNISE